MSITAVKWALNAKIGQTKKLVLVTIAESHNRKTGDCFPSQKYIADVIGQKERATRYHLAELEADGFITRKHRYDRRGKRTSDGYIFNLEISEPTTGKRMPVDYRRCHAGSTGRLPANSERLPAPLCRTTGNCVPVHIDEPELTGRLEPEESKSAPPALIAVKPAAEIIIQAEVVDPIETEFEQRFWPLYPNKVGKPSALRAYKKARKKVGADTILLGLEVYRNKNDYRQWKGPAAWLNDERWGDEPAKVRDPHVTATMRTGQKWLDELAARRNAAATTAA